MGIAGDWTAGFRADTLQAVSELHDTQSQPDDRNLPINRVGVKNLRHPIRVKDRAVGSQDTVATVQLTVDLPHQFKGTHMSRFVEILQSHGRVIQIESISELARQLAARLESQCAHTTFRFPYFIEKRAPVSGLTGLVDYDVTLETTLDGDHLDLVLTVSVPITTLCPCSKAISENGAHNQRGRVDLAVRFSETVWIEDLVALVEASGSSELFSVLKRPDEKAVTERAYANPVFVEDVVRNVSLRCREDPRITWHRVEAENFESIHNHNAYACIEFP